MSSKRTVVKKRLDLLEDSGTLATVLYQDGLVKVADVNFFNFLKSTQPITSFPANDLGHTTGLNVVPNSMKVPLDKISEGLTAFAYYDDGLYYPATVNKLSNTVKRRKKDDERSTTHDPNKENNKTPNSDESKTKKGRGSSEKKPKKKQGSASKNHVKTNTDTEESEIKKRKKQDEQAKKEAQVNRKLVELNRIYPTNLPSKEQSYAMELQPIPKTPTTEKGINNRDDANDESYNNNDKNPTIRKSLHSSLSASSPPSLPGGSPSSRLSGIGFGIARSLGVTSCVHCEQKDVQIFKLKNTIQNYEQQLNDKDTVTTEQTTAIIKANEENENLKEQVRILNQSNQGLQQQLQQQQLQQQQPQQQPQQQQQPPQQPPQMVELSPGTGVMVMHETLCVALLKPLANDCLPYLIRRFFTHQTQTRLTVEEEETDTHTIIPPHIKHAIFQFCLVNCQDKLERTKKGVQPQLVKCTLPRLKVFCTRTFQMARTYLKKSKSLPTRHESGRY